MKTFTRMTYLISRTKIIFSTPVLGLYLNLFYSTRPKMIDWLRRIPLRNLSDVFLSLVKDSFMYANALYLEMLIENNKFVTTLSSKS